MMDVLLNVIKEIIKSLQLHEQSLELIYEILKTQKDKK